MKKTLSGALNFYQLHHFRGLFSNEESISFTLYCAYVLPFVCVPSKKYASSVRTLKRSMSYPKQLCLSVGFSEISKNFLVISKNHCENSLKSLFQKWLLGEKGFFFGGEGGRAPHFLVTLLKIILKDSLEIHNLFR